MTQVPLPSRRRRALNYIINAVRVFATIDLRKIKIALRKFSTLPNFIRLARAHRTRMESNLTQVTLRSS